MSSSLSSSQVPVVAREVVALERDVTGVLGVLLEEREPEGVCATASIGGVMQFIFIASQRQDLRTLCY